MMTPTGSRELSLFDPTFTQLLDEMIDVFPRSESSSPRAEAPFPALNAWDDADALTVEAEVPGLKREELELSVREDELSIHGERKTDHPEGATVLRHERSAGTFHRTVRLPYAVDATKIEAALKDGVLTITLPKAAELKPRKIEVKVRNP